MSKRSTKHELLSHSSPVFLSMMRHMGLFGAASLGSVDRFLVCIRDVLQQLLGPGPAVPGDLPLPLPAASAGVPKANESVDIKVLARIARKLIQAYFTNPVLLAAREAGRKLSPRDSDSEENHWGPRASEVLASGSFAGPSGPGDFVPVPDQGPLRRSLAFMEQSPLLQVVQSKLCAAQFDDVVGATEQLEAFALRNLRVLWFDLRRCTSTLKRESCGAKAVGAGGANASVRLVLKNLRLCLVHDWEAKLATFPYLQLGGSSQVTVRTLSISVQLSLGINEGVVFRGVDVGSPDLEVELGCASAFSLVVLSALLQIFKTSLQDHLQRQVRRILMHLLQQEASKWNESTWKAMMACAPERLVSGALNWLCANIPPEGLPI